MQQGVIAGRDISNVVIPKGWNWKRPEFIAVHTRDGRYYRMNMKQLIKLLQSGTFDVKKPRVYHHLITMEDV
jgi:hypothetical protein